MRAMSASLLRALLSLEAQGDGEGAKLNIC
jgi:hypothetical protein